MIQRKIEDRLFNSLVPNKAVLLFGARRVGKTILLKQIIQRFNGKSLLLNGEDYDTLALLEPQSIANYNKLLNDIELLVIDEAQNIPDIGKKLKLIVDEIPSIKVLASGSSSFDLQNKAGEPLVGRCTNFHLFPFSQSELSQNENLLETRQNLETRLIYGTYPEITTITNFEQKKDYLREIVNAYLLKDILSIDGLKNSKKMGDLLRLIALQLGNEVSYDQLSKQLGLSRNTVEKYLDLLSQVFVVFRLGAYSTNLRKEITKAGEWFFYDNGIRNALINNYDAISLRSDMGQLWENYLISERLKRNSYLNLNNNYYFWRTYDGQEIDLIEVNENQLNTVEIKWGNKTPKQPKAFRINYPESNYTVVNQDNYLDFVL